MFFVMTASALSAAPAAAAAARARAPATVNTAAVSCDRRRNAELVVAGVVWNRFWMSAASGGSVGGRRPVVVRD